MDSIALFFTLGFMALAPWVVATVIIVFVWRLLFGRRDDYEDYD